jgi:hypothetical protein
MPRESSSPSRDCSTNIRAAALSDEEVGSSSGEEQIPAQKLSKGKGKAKAEPVEPVDEEEDDDEQEEDEYVRLAMIWLASLTIGQIRRRKDHGTQSFKGKRATLQRARVQTDTPRAQSSTT